MGKYNYILLVFLYLVVSCQKKRYLPDYSARYPRMVDTQVVSIQEQIKKLYVFNKGISFSNLFAGARFNNVQQQDKDTFIINIKPENEPINSSPWYAFKVYNPSLDTIIVKLDYGAYDHRYSPKIISNGEVEPYPISLTGNDIDSSFYLKIPTTKDTLLLSAQEIITSKEVSSWMIRQNKNENCSISSIGLTPFLNPMYRMILSGSEMKYKPTIVLLSRQHPPEVTGQKALFYFVESILASENSENFLSEYNVVIYPMLNPDGVNNGHWRHNSQGKDLNRDWALYNLAETKMVAEDLYKLTEKYTLDIVLGLDFHSTFYDIYYTNVSDATSDLPDFTENWLSYINQIIPDYKPRVSPSNIGAPVSKNWFFINFNAVGITYEIGDDTNDEFIQLKAEKSAIAMIDILLNTNINTK